MSRAPARMGVRFAIKNSFCQSATWPNQEVWQHTVGI